MAAKVCLRVDKLKIKYTAHVFKQTIVLFHKDTAYLWNVGGEISFSPMKDLQKCITSLYSPQIWDARKIPHLARMAIRYLILNKYNSKQLAQTHTLFIIYKCRYTPISLIFSCKLLVQIQVPKKVSFLSSKMPCYEWYIFHIQFPWS